MKPEIIGLYSLIFKEAKLFPDLARELYEKGPMLGTIKLSELLQNCINEGKLKNLPSYKAVEIFLNGIKEN